MGLIPTFTLPAIPATPLRFELLRTNMGVRAQFNNNTNCRNVHNLQVTASILTHLATQPTSAIPERQRVKQTRLPSIRSLFTINTAHNGAAVLPPLHCAVELINLGTPNTVHQSSTISPIKSIVGSPTSPGMTSISLTYRDDPIATLTSPINTKTRRPLSLSDLLSNETPSCPSAHRCRNVHHRRQCGISDCQKYALTGGFCIRHGGGKRCNYEGCQTVAQSGGRCKAHGGGSKCKVAGCSSVARRKGFCMTHGGRQQCKINGCLKCAHGGGFCISHGGGKRCSAKACDKSAQAGGFCYSHGGGKRCAAPECFQAARKGGLCIRHRKLATGM